MAVPTLKWLNFEELDFKSLKKLKSVDAPVQLSGLRLGHYSTPSGDFSRQAVRDFKK